MRVGAIDLVAQRVLLLFQRLGGGVAFGELRRELRDAPIDFGDLLGNRFQL